MIGICDLCDKEGEGVNYAQSHVGECFICHECTITNIPEAQKMYKYILTGEEVFLERIVGGRIEVKFPDLAPVQFMSLENFWGDFEKTKEE